jgi:hypothetical protein
MIANGQQSTDSISAHKRLLVGLQHLIVGSPIKGNQTTWWWTLAINQMVQQPLVCVTSALEESQATRGLGCLETLRPEASSIASTSQFIVIKRQPDSRLLEATAATKLKWIP